MILFWSAILFLVLTLGLSWAYSFDKRLDEIGRERRSILDDMRKDAENDD